MIRDDIENLNYSELTELEKLEFTLKLAQSCQKTILQLMAGGEIAIASIFSNTLNFRETAPDLFQHLCKYVAELYKVQVNRTLMGTQVSNLKTEIPKEDAEEQKVDIDISEDEKAN